MVDETRSIQSVERAMSILEVIAHAGGQARLSEIAKQTNIHKSTLHGLLNTLTALGYITRHGSAYGLGLRLREITQPLTDTDARLKKHFTPALNRLAELSDETCYLAVPCGTREYLYIDAREGSQNLRLNSPRGRREGLRTSAIGKVFLAFDNELLRSLRKASKVAAPLEDELIQIRDSGYSLDLGVAEAGLNCLALPLSFEGRVVAAIGVAGPSQRLSKRKLLSLKRAFLA